MNFELPEQLKMVQNLARDFVNEQLKPLERDLLGRASDLSDAKTSLPAGTEEKLAKAASDIGLWGINLPEELGGMGLGILCSCLVEEELAQTIVPFNFGDVTPILYDCNDEQKERYLIPVLERQRYAYLALIEPNKGARIDNLETQAKREQSCYVINGQKLSFSRAGGDYFAVVFTTTETADKDMVTCFLVDKDTPGFSVSEDRFQTGWRTQEKEPILLSFDNCRVSTKNILGEEGKAFRLGNKWLTGRRLIRGAKYVGAAQRLLDEAVTQVQSFHSFGQVLSNRLGSVAALTDIAMWIHASRLMVFEAAWKADNGESIKYEAAMVKLHTTQMLQSVADRVAFIFNGPHYISGLPMERLCRNILASNTIELGLELQRSVIAGAILKGLRV